MSRYSLLARRRVGSASPARPGTPEATLAQVKDLEEELTRAGVALDRSEAARAAAERAIAAARQTVEGQRALSAAAAAHAAELEDVRREAAAERQGLLDRLERAGEALEAERSRSAALAKEKQDIAVDAASARATAASLEKQIASLEQDIAALRAQRATPPAGWDITIWRDELGAAQSLKLKRSESSGG